MPGYAHWKQISSLLPWPQLSMEIHSIVPPENCDVAERICCTTFTFLLNRAIFAMERNFRATSAHFGLFFISSGDSAVGSDPHPPVVRASALPAFRSKAVIGRRRVPYQSVVDGHVSVSSLHAQTSVALGEQRSY